MKQLSFYEQGYKVGYDLNGFGDNVIEIAIAKMDLPKEYVQGLKHGRRDGKRDRRIEEREKAMQDGRDYWRHIQAERQKQIDYDKLTPEQRMSRGNKKKAEDLKFKYEQTIKTHKTDPFTIWLKEQVAKELKGGKTTEPKEKNSTKSEEKIISKNDPQVADKKDTSKDIPKAEDQTHKEETGKEKSVAEERMTELEEIRNSQTEYEKKEVGTEGISIVSPYGEELNLDKTSSVVTERMEELEKITEQNKEQELSKDK